MERTEHDLTQHPMPEKLSLSLSFTPVEVGSGRASVVVGGCVMLCSESTNFRLKAIFEFRHFSHQHCTQVCHPTVRSRLLGCWGTSSVDWKCCFSDCNTGTSGVDLKCCFSD